MSVLLQLFIAFRLYLLPRPQLNVQVVVGLEGRILSCDASGPAAQPDSV